MNRERLHRLIQGLLDDADEATRRGDWETVAAVAADVLALDPDQAEARGFAALASRRIGARGAPDHHRQITVMFVDIVGWTPIAERLAPDRLRDLARAYGEIVDQAVGRYDGNVAFRMGDGRMVLFGLPSAHEDDARRAVLAGLAIVDAVGRLAGGWRDELGHDLQVRVGAHTGPVLVTELAAQTQLLGTTTNEAARIQEASAPGSVTISDTTWQLTCDHVDGDDLGAVALRGVGRPLRLWRIRPAAGPVLAAPVLPLIGREVERARLEDHVDRAPGSAGPPVLAVVGDPGLGKTRLVRSAIDHVEARGRQVIVARCSAIDQSTPFAPVLAALATRAGLDRVHTPLDRRDALARTLGADDVGTEAIASLLQLPAGSGRPELKALDANARHRLSVTTLARWLTAASRRDADPGLVVIEDLHWADGSTVDVITQLTRDNSTAVLVTTRPAFRAPWLVDDTTVRIERLPDRDSRRIAELLAPSGTPGHQLARLVERADGVPLFLMALARHRHHAGDDLPASLHEVLLAHVDQPGVDLDLLQWIATIGREVDVDLVAEATDRTRRHLEVQLHDLQARGLLERTAAGTYVFHHALIQEEAYRSQIDSTRAVRHDVLADLLLARRAAGHQVAPMNIARHLAGCARLVEAHRITIEAAFTAQRDGAHRDAVSMLTIALEHLALRPAGEHRDLDELSARIQLALSLTATSGYGSRRLIANYEAAHALIADVPADMRAFGLLVSIWTYWATHGRSERATEALTELQRVVTEADLPMQAEVDVCRAQGLVSQGYLDEASSLLERAIATTRYRDARPRRPAGTQPGDTKAGATAQLTFVHWLRGRRTDAFDVAERGVAHAVELGPGMAPFNVASIRAWHSHVLSLEGRHDEALAMAEEMIAYCRQYGVGSYRSMAEQRRLYELAHLAPSVEIAASIGATIDLLRAADVWTMSGYNITEHGTLLCRLGDHERGIAVIEQAITTSAATGERTHLAESHRELAGALLAVPDRIDEVAHHLDVAHGIALAQGAAVLRLRAALDGACLVSSGRLPDRHRDARTASEWRARLVAAVAAVPDQGYAEVERAHAVLAGSGPA